MVKTNEADMKNIADLSAEEFKSFMDSFDVVLSDCDGTLWKANPIPHAGETIHALEKKGKRVYFVTNNTMRPQSDYQKMFDTMAVPNGMDNLLHPAIAITKYLKTRNMTKRIFAVANSFAVDYYKSVGFDVFTGPDEYEQNPYSMMKFLKDRESVGAVVIDIDTTCNNLKLQMAAYFLQIADTEYLTGSTEATFSVEGEKYIGPRYYQDVVTKFTEREPKQFSKPNLHFLDQFMKDKKIMDPKRVLMVGDQVEEDVMLAKNGGFESMFVLTGRDSLKDFEKKPFKPDYYIASFGDLAAMLKE